MRNFKQINTKCTTFKYIDAQGNRVEKPKQQFETEAEALEKAFYLNAYGSSIRKLSAYKCWTCGKWHIGRTPHVLTKEDREKYKEKYIKIKKAKK